MLGMFAAGMAQECCLPNQSVQEKTGFEILSGDGLRPRSGKAIRTRVSWLLSGRYLDASSVI